MMKPLWKGGIRLGLGRVPVELYPAVRHEESMFALIDGRDNSPIEYRKVNARTGEEVPPEAVAKALRVEEFRYVPIDEEELRQASGKVPHTIEPAAVVRVDEVDPAYYDKPYFLAPGEGDAKPYVLLREALLKTGRVVLSRVHLWGRERLALIRARGKHLMLLLLRFPRELSDGSDVEVPGKDLRALGVRGAEVWSAVRLLEGLVQPWDPGAYKDDFSERVEEIVRRSVG